MSRQLKIVVASSLATIQCTSRKEVLPSVVSEPAPEAEIQAAPSNTGVDVSCDLQDEPNMADSTLNFRGKPVKYFSSSEIPYHQDTWMGRTQPWVSFAGLDSTIIGFPGFDGTSAGRAFSATAPVNVRVSVVDIRKVGGQLKYHYFSNETMDSPMENWSSTKALAMTMAAHAIRMKSGHTHGMQSLITSTGASLGSAVTQVADTSNNRTAIYLKSFIGAAGAHNMARNWLGGGARTEFGGSHGEASQPWGNRLTSQGNVKTFAGAGSFAATSNNTLMPVLMAEYWKRIGVNTLDTRTWIKKVDYAGKTMSEAERKAALDSGDVSVTPQDVGVLLYGTASGSNFGGLLFGAAHNDGFVEAIGGKGNLDQKFAGKWRIYGKTGTGSAVRSGRSRNEQIIGGFVCLPASANNTVLKQGRAFAFFINVQAAGPTGAIRQASLKAVSAAMAPEVLGGRNLWTR